MFLDVLSDSNSTVNHFQDLINRKHKGAITTIDARNHFFVNIVPRLTETSGHFVKTEYVKHRKGDGAPIVSIELVGK